jgi:signal transduction histidine kinase
VSQDIPSRQDFKRLHVLFEEQRDLVDRAIADFSKGKPNLAAVGPSPLRLPQHIQAGTPDREAVVERAWQAYLDDLRAGAEVHAQRGIDFADWFTLVAATRDALLGGVEIDPRHRETLDELLAVQDVNVLTVGAAYHASKQGAARDIETRLQLFVDVVNQARPGVLVYRWEAPPDPGTLRLLIQNDAATRLGSTRDQLGRTLREATPALLDTPVATYYADTYRTGQPRSWGIDWRFDDGRIVNFEANCYPLGGDHLVVFFDDVSDKHRARRELEERALELARSNRELDDFAYVASHDLKTPLRDIHNLATWIADDLGDQVPDGTKRHLGLLKDRVGRMETLLDDLLEYSRAGRAQSAVESIEIASVVSSVVALLDPHGHVVEQRGSVKRVNAARAGFELALRNLIANAIAHHDRPAGLIVVSAEPAGDGWIQVDVSDDGPGIPKEHHERVFRMFQTLATPELNRGSGMGLAVVRKVVEAHGGRAELISEGRGTTVRMRWPSEKAT